MSRVYIHHRTVYRYSAPVRLGLHRLVLRPRESHELTVSSHRLVFQPRAEVRWMNDVFGNHCAFAEFPDPAAELVIDSQAIIDRVDKGEDAGAVEMPSASRMTLPLAFLQPEQAIAQAYLIPTYPDEAAEVRDWVTGIVGHAPQITAMEAAQKITTGIFCGIEYRRREEAGVQSPATTLRLGTGSCRDMATLGMEALRGLGIPARFVSGYLNSLASLAGRGCTHAWFDAYLPDCGWWGFDATSGKPATRSQIPTGVSSHPRGVMPISGKFDNSTGTSLGMSVAVTIRHDSPEGLKGAA